MSEPRWLNAEEAHAWRSLQQMQMRLDGELARQLTSESDLSYPDYRVLVALTAQPSGRMRLFELGDVLGWEKSRLSHHVGRMAGRGLVTKQRCPSDGRGAIVVVSDLGRAMIEASAPGHVEMVRELFVDRLTPEQLATVAAVADAVLAALDEAAA